MMRARNRYFVEYLFLAIVVLLTITGFWNIYFGANAAPTLHHLLHITTNVIWLSLLACQLILTANRKHLQHRKVGILVLFCGPLVFATTALLSVYSAHKGVVSGEGDFLIVQNVMVTLELGLAILAAFLLRKRRKLHGAFLLSTGILFMGIALFFTLISFVPPFKVEGPETFYRFQTAGIAGQATCLVVGLLFFIRDWRNGWPMLLVSSFFVLNEILRSSLAKHDLIQPLTEFVGSLSQPFTFVGSFLLLFALLMATGMQGVPRLRADRAAPAV